QCWLFGSYSMRQRRQLVMNQAFPPEAMRLERVHGKGIASDSLVGILGNPGENADNTLGWSATWFNPALGRNMTFPINREEYRRAFMENHDRSWNVLFSDGSVKTYSDSSLAVTYALLDATPTEVWALPPWGNIIYLSQTSIPEGPAIEKTVWSVYFDSLYAQD
ncbi:MAG: hypothetical protein V2A58_15880, partial [Planctomycetota bacterium]